MRKQDAKSRRRKKSKKKDPEEEEEPEVRARGEAEPEGEEESEEEEDHQVCSSDTDIIDSAINVIHCRKQSISLILASHVFRIL